MEIGGMNSMYTDYLANQISSSQSTTLQSKLDNSDYSTATDEELKQACKEFEAYFVEQVFNAMLETTKVFSEEENSYATKMVDYFKDTAVQELCNEVTEGNGIGIANTLYEQMKRQYSSVNIESVST